MPVHTSAIRRYSQHLCSVLISLATLWAAPLNASDLLSQWATPAEASNYSSTPDYAETMSYLRRIADSAQGEVKLETFGRSGEGRDLVIAIASADGVFDPEKIHASGRPILMVQNSIHAGEMDGKDACLALLRDMVITKTRAALLQHAVFIFIPIYNPDGHERRSQWNRINQNGPAVIGWRGNGSNLNLNRDYMKAEAPETQALLHMMHRWLPDFLVDDHVTDGADYQYDVTFTMNSGPNVPQETARWVASTVAPQVEQYVDENGHLASPNYIDLNNSTDPAQGLGWYSDPPRYSTGYWVLENRPAMLVELHMLKDYRTRVTGNYTLLCGLLQILNRDSAKLLAMNQAADSAAARLGAYPLSNSRYPLKLEWGGETTPFLFRGYAFDRMLSPISGTMSIRYKPEPWNVSLPLQTGAKVTLSTVPPRAYILPPQWTAVIDTLRAHDVIMRKTTASWTGQVETYHCSGMQWQGHPFEARHPLFDGEAIQEQPGHFGLCTQSTEEVTFPAGSVVVELNQRLSQVAIHWLEPEAPDSALRWGYFDSIFEQKEYGEAYVLEKLASQMLEKDMRLRTEFERKIANDPSFAASPYLRLEWFYEQTPYFAANRVGLYPVGRLASIKGIPLDQPSRTP